MIRTLDAFFFFTLTRFFHFFSESKPTSSNARHVSAHMPRSLKNSSSGTGKNKTNNDGRSKSRKNATTKRSGVNQSKGKQKKPVSGNITKKKRRVASPKKSLLFYYHNYDASHFYRTINNRFDTTGRASTQLPNQQMIVGKNGPGKHAIRQQCVRRSEKDVNVQLNKIALHVICQVAEATADIDHSKLASARLDSLKKDDQGSIYKRCQVKTVREAIFQLTGKYPLSSYLKKTNHLKQKKKKQTTKTTEKESNVAGPQRSSSDDDAIVDDDM